MFTGSNAAASGLSEGAGSGGAPRFSGRTRFAPAPTRRMGSVSEDQQPDL